MKVLIGLFRVITTLGTLVFAEIASAAVMQATWRGTLSRGASDLTNTFGAGTDIGGLAYQLVFVYDTLGIGAVRTTTPESDIIFGDRDFGMGSPVKSAKITINDHVQSIGTNYGSAATFRFEGAGFVNHAAGSSTYNSRLIQSSFVYASWRSTDPFDSPVNLEVPVPFMQFHDEDYEFDLDYIYIDECQRIENICNVTKDVSGRLLPQSLEIVAVPVTSALHLLVSALFGFVIAKRWHNLARKAPAA